MCLDNFDGHEPVEQWILSQIDRGHAALAELIENPVSSVFHGTQLASRVIASSYVRQSASMRTITSVYRADA